MTFEEVEAAFVSRLRATWAYPDVPVYIDNQVFTPSDSYVQMFLLFVSTEPVGFTSGPGVSDKQNGILQFNIYTEVGIGPGLGNRIADRLGLLFNNKRFSGIECMTYTVRSFGTDNGKHRVVTEIPYQWYLQSEVVENG